MVFSSITFLFYFLPIVIVAYFLLPYKNSVLLVSSLIFYSWGEPKYIILMVVTVFINYVCGLLIAKNKNHSKLYLIMALIFSMGALIIFKYADFIISTMNTVAHTNVAPLQLALPIGISFYTFQILTYTIDVYRDDVPVQNNYFTLLTYVSLFPQLIAGPIVRYSDVADELHERSSTITLIFDGITRFVVGLSKKVIIANTLAEITQSFGQQTSPSFIMVWLYAISFTLQLYYDFSGYSDMAIGLGKVFGFNFLENFDYPLTAVSVTDFWRRWHISLGTFFKDYVYIPLGGNRVNKSRWIVNIVIVWALTGLWHGAAYNFIVWGLFFALLLIFEKIFNVNSHKRTLFKTTYVLVAIIMSFVVFDSSSLIAATQTIKSMLMLHNQPIFDPLSTFYVTHYALVLIIAIVGATPLVNKTYHKIMCQRSETFTVVIQSALTSIAFILCVLMLVDASFNPFLYFRF